MSEDALEPTLAEYRALAPGDQRAVERQLSADALRLLRQALAKGALPAEPTQPRIDVSAYSASLTKHLLRLMADHEDAPAVTTATRETLLRLLSGERV